MADVQITIRNNGPYLIQAPVSLVDADGNAVSTGDRATVALCRCGSSSNKPFCDGTHNRSRFDGALAAQS
jgi:CDGSH-type Zn-finger protein